MLKKITSIILSIAMLMTGISVFAAVDTSTAGLTIYTDNFEHHNITQNTNITKYTNTGYASDVFGAGYGQGVHLLLNGGPDSSKALKIGIVGDDCSVVTKAITASQSGEVIELSYDLKLGYPTAASQDGAMKLGAYDLYGSGPMFEIVYDAEKGGLIKDSVGGNTYAYDKNAWYKVIITQYKSGGRRGWILDNEGNVVLQATRTSQAWAQIGAVYSRWNCNHEAVIDNAVLKHYDLAQIAPVVKSISIADATDVALDTKSATVVFSQPVSGTAKITGGAAAINCTMTLASATPDSYTYTVSWTGALAPETTYTLDLSAVKNAGALAAASSTATFTTVAQAVVKESDSFSTADGSHYQSGTGYISNVLIMENWDVGRTSMVTGYTGDALQISTVTDGTQKQMNVLRTRKAYTPAANKSFVLTYRLNMKEFDPEYLCRVYIGVNSSSSGWMSSDNALGLIIDMDDERYIMSPSASNKTAYKLDTDKWYDIIMSFNGTKANISLIDSVTGEVLWTGLEKDYAYLNVASYYFVPFYVTCYSDATYGSINKNQIFVLDDFTIWTVRKDKDLVLTESTVSDSFALDGKVSLTFNQPVLGTPAMYSLYQGTTNNKEAYSDIKINCKNFCTQEISFSALNYQTDYTLDYSGIAAASGADLGESTAASVIEFTTEDSPFDAVITGDVTVSGVEAGDTISFNLESNVNTNALVIAALYNENSLAGFAVQADATISAGDSNSVTVTLPKTYDANIIKLYVWTGATFAPLMPEYIVLAD